MTQIRTSFVSRIDFWLLALVVLAGMAAAAAAVAAVPRTGDSGNSWGLLLTLGPLVAFGLILPAWLVLDTRYTLTAHELLIRSGPLRWRIALNEVRELSPSRSWISSPALSLDRLRIRYGAARSILVSPRDKQGFIDTLRQRAPAVLLSGF
jgi:carbon starvation protein CstA